MNTAQSTGRGSAAVASRFGKNADFSLVFSASTIRTTPRGYRELRSPAEMRKLLNRKVIEQDGKCAICRSTFTDYSEIVPDHIEPKGMGGAWRDDHPDNVQAVHGRCNLEKGSRRLVDR